ncbi:MAG: MalY/PatB family protein [Chloroflexota bacterium]|nr:MalY/PatB family protein [Chloroflexota bacterium]
MALKYDLDEIISRAGTNSVKWESGKYLIRKGVIERFDQDTIALFLADMDFQCPQPLLEALHARVEQRIFGYTSYLTSPDYVDAIQGWFKRRHHWEITADSIVYSPGTVQAIDALIRAFTAEGDGVIIQRPVYGPFTNRIEANRRSVVNNSLVNDDGYYTIDFDDLAEKARYSQNTLFLLCSPHNPVGRVWRPDELIRMAEICLANDVVFVSDEIHGDLIRKDKTHHPIHTLVEDDRLISCTAINKTFNTAGLHCSNIIIDNKEMREQFSAALGRKSPTPFAITALIAAYDHGEEWLAQVNGYVDDNLAFLARFIEENMPGVRYWIPEGTYFAWLDFRGYGLSAAEIHDRIYNKANVVLQDGERYGPEGQGFQRICVPSPRSILREALQRIAAKF